MAEKNAKERLGGEVKLGHNLVSILKNADENVEWPSFIKLYDQLRGGIFLNNKTKKYWFDDKTNSNRFMVFGRGLTIAWSDDTRYWKWSFDPIEKIEVAELIEVSWLDIEGKIKTSDLSQKTSYEAVFVVKLSNQASGWNFPVHLKLKKPDGSTQERTEVLEGKPKEQWFEIPVGNFIRNDYENSGEFEFTLYEHGGHWKTGLILKGLAIRPKG